MSCIITRLFDKFLTNLLTFSQDFFQSIKSYHSRKNSGPANDIPDVSSELTQLVNTMKAFVELNSMAMIVPARLKQVKKVVEVLSTYIDTHT